ncbi:MAG: hypothetical protein FJ280_26500 [Planctomycetes bacterium]|nr:hypothetical protein [Planctomycetota bacterium]
MMDAPVIPPRPAPHNRALRRIHLLSTVWFIACIGYILVLVLRQVGFQWWLIFSLSGPSALVVLVLISLYLFALYRGMGETQQIEAEHPLTTNSYYMALYVAAPMLGGLAGTLGMVGVTEPTRFLLGIALGTLGTTFAVWIVIDPIAGLLEMFLPASRQHRSARLAQVEAQRRARQEKREHLLAEAFAREERERRHWQQKLQSQAQRLAALLACDAANLAQAEQEAVDIGAEAWRLGGLSCMRQLHEMTIAAAQGRDPGAGSRGTQVPAQTGPAVSRSRDRSADYLSYWWDGVGDWHRPSWD